MIIKVIDPASVRQLIRDYRLPISATIVFIAIVIFMLIGRLQERSVLGQILDINNSGGQGYANLLSKDKSDQFTKNDVGDIGNSQSGNSPTVPGGSSPPAPATGTGTASNTPATGGVVQNPGTGGGPIVPTPIFSASITDFRQDKAPALQCASGPPTNPGSLFKCNKTYSYIANVQALNGPGSVSYGWLYSVSGSNNGSYSASGGTSTNTLRNEIALSCRDPGTFTAQFTLTSPNSSQSQIIQISHNCTL